MAKVLLAQGEALWCPLCWLAASSIIWAECPSVQLFSHLDDTLFPGLLLTDDRSIWVSQQLALSLVHGGHSLKPDKLKKEQKREERKGGRGSQRLSVCIDCHCLQPGLFEASSPRAQPCPCSLPRVESSTWRGAGGSVSSPLLHRSHHTAWRCQHGH